jgi:hypothetical protein
VKGYLVDSWVLQLEGDAFLLLVEVAPHLVCVRTEYGVCFFWQVVDHINELDRYWQDFWDCLLSLLIIAPKDT